MRAFFGACALAVLALVGCDNGTTAPHPDNGNPPPAADGDADDQRARAVGREMGERAQELGERAEEAGQEMKEKVHEFSHGFQEGYSNPTPDKGE